MVEVRLLGGPCSVCQRYDKDINFGDDAWWPLDYGEAGHCLVCPECARKLYASVPEDEWRRDYRGTLRRVYAPYLSKEPRPITPTDDDPFFTYKWDD